MDSDERTESANERNRRNELIAKGGCLPGDSVPKPLGFFRFTAHPSEIKFDVGAQRSLNPSLVLAPESALSLLPSRGLSSAPATRSVFKEADGFNDGKKK